MTLNRVLEYYLEKALTRPETDSNAVSDSGFHHNDHRWVCVMAVHKRYSKAQGQSLLKM